MSLPDFNTVSTGEIEWNYTKFLVGADGKPARRYRSRLDPLEFEADVRLLLAGKPPLPGSCLRKLSPECDVDGILGVET